MILAIRPYGKSHAVTLAKLWAYKLYWKLIWMRPKIFFHSTTFGRRREKENHAKNVFQTSFHPVFNCQMTFWPSNTKRASFLQKIFSPFKGSYLNFFKGMTPTIFGRLFFFFWCKSVSPASKLNQSWRSNYLLLSRNFINLKCITYMDVNP